MNTKRFDDKPRQEVKQKDSARCGNRYSHRRRKRFVNHLPLHPNKCQYQAGTWSRRPKLPPELLAQFRGKDAALYDLICQNVDNETQICDRRQVWFKNKLRCSLSSIERSVRRLIKLQLIENRKTRIGAIIYLLQPPCDPAKMTGGKNGSKLNEYTVANAPVYSSTSADAPVPRARVFNGPRSPHPSSPDEPPGFPEPVKPASEPPKTWQRKRWNGRSQSIYRWRLTPVQESAKQVMAALGVAERLWKIREAIAHAIRQWGEQNPGQDLDAAIAALVAIRQDFLRAFRAGLLWRDYLVEEYSFFQKNFWQDRNSWGWRHGGLKAGQLAKEARVGTCDPTSTTGANWGMTYEEKFAAASDEEKRQYEYFRKREKGEECSAK